MGVFEFILGIIVIGSGFSVINKWIAAKHGYEIEDSDGERMTKIVHQPDAASLKRIEQLEKRVRVLERIATDEGARLASEIDALADERETDLSDALSRPALEIREPSR